MYAYLNSLFKKKLAKIESRCDALKGLFDQNLNQRALWGVSVKANHYFVDLHWSTGTEDSSATILAEAIGRSTAAHLDNSVGGIKLEYLVRPSQLVTSI